MFKLKRFDSLFARLLLLQAVLASAVLLVFGALLYVERNVTIARLVGQRLAPVLRQAAGWPAVPDSTAPPMVLRGAGRPQDERVAGQNAPRLRALADELRRRGVPLQDSVLARGDGGPVLWLLVGTPAGEAVWLGVADPALAARLPGRFLLAVLLATLLVAGVSWAFTRRLTRPLEQLRTRMLSLRPGEALPAAGQPKHRSASPEIAAMEAAYDELLQRFERHERERSLLLAGVSHDLRSPLARIRTAAELLPESPDAAPWRDAIVRNTQAADRLIGSFLDHVRAGELALDQAADLAAVARAAAAATGRPADELVVHAEAPVLLAQTHPLLLERLIDNLLDNAFKHGRAPVELFVADRGDGFALVEVSDAGEGLPDARREALLQAFARGDSARGTPGTGLGLAIVARTVARMGGTLAFERREGRHVVSVLLRRTG